MSPVNESLIEFPCAFPIKVMGKAQDGFRETITALLQTFDAGFDDDRIETRLSGAGNYVGLTCTVHARDRAHLDDIYRALTSHPMVSFVL